MHQILGWNKMSMLGGKASHTRTSVAGSAVHCRITKDISTELILWTEKEGIGNSVNIPESFTSCFAYLWNMYLILEENYKYYCGSIFCGHCSLSVCIHVILLAGCVSNFRYKKRSSALFELQDEVSPYHILLPDYGQQPKKTVSWQQETNEITHWQRQHLELRVMKWKLKLLIYMATLVVKSRTL